MIPYDKWSHERIRGLLTYICAIQTGVYFTLLYIQRTTHLRHTLRSQLESSCLTQVGIWGCCRNENEVIIIRTRLCTFCYDLKLGKKYVARRFHVFQVPASWKLSHFTAKTMSSLNTAAFGLYCSANIKQFHRRRDVVYQTVVHTVHWPLHGVWSLSRPSASRSDGQPPLSWRAFRPIRHPSVPHGGSDELPRNRRLRLRWVYNIKRTIIQEARSSSANRAKPLWITIHTVCLLF